MSYVILILSSLSMLTCISCGVDYNSNYRGKAPKCIECRKENSVRFCVSCNVGHPSNDTGKTPQCSGCKSKRHLCLCCEEEYIPIKVYGPIIKQEAFCTKCNAIRANFKKTGSNDFHKDVSIRLFYQTYVKNGNGSDESSLDHVAEGDEFSRTYPLAKMFTNSDIDDYLDVKIATKKMKIYAFPRYCCPNFTHSSCKKFIITNAFILKTPYFDLG